MEAQETPVNEQDSKQKRYNYYVCNIEKCFTSKRELIAFLNSREPSEAPLQIVRGMQVELSEKRVYDIN